MSIEVLEETLCVQSLPLNNIFEAFNYGFGNFFIAFCSRLSAVDSVGSSVIQNDIDALLKVFLGENFVYKITESLP